MAESLNAREGGEWQCFDPPVPIEVESVTIIDKNYDIASYPLWDAPSQEMEPKQSFWLVEDSVTRDWVMDIWGKLVIDSRDQVWQVVGGCSLDNGGKQITVQVYRPDYIYKIIRCSVCEGIGYRVSRIEENVEISLCPMIGWTKNIDTFTYNHIATYTHRHCAEGPKPERKAKREIEVIDGVEYENVSIDMTDTFSSAKIFHRECKAHAEWWGFIDPNPLKWAGE